MGNKMMQVCRVLDCKRACCGNPLVVTGWGTHRMRQSLYVLGLQASGGEWNKDLMFSVPIDHPEVLRLQGRYKK